jgi:hypothetical protein
MTTITALSTPPSRSDPSNFATRADAFFGALPTFATETNLVASEVNADAANALASANSANDSKVAAQGSATAAAQSAVDAASAAGATQWISGTTYTAGNVVWSPLTYLNYRRKVTGGGTTDPSLDTTNWALLGVPTTFPTLEISTNTNAAVSTHYLFASSLMLTLPPSPSIGNEVEFTNLSGTTTCVINPNGNKIRGDSTNMNVNLVNASARLVYTGTTRGWV